MRTARMQLAAWLVLGFAGCATTTPTVNEIPSLACQDLGDCRTSCRNGSRNACRALGLMLANAAQDAGGSRAAAVENALHRGCEIGDMEACSQLGDVLLGSTTAGTIRQAVNAFARACDGGLARACLQLGAMYARGDAAGAKDEARAMRLYEQACALGHPVACNRLGMMYELGRTTARDPQRALAYYNVGCERQSAEACTNAGVLLLTAHTANDAASFRAALQLFRKGCDGGDRRACDLLAEKSI